MSASSPLSRTPWPGCRDPEAMQPFAYMRARTAEEAVEATTTSGLQTRFLAGGTTLYDLMKLGIETPANVVDITRIAELDAIETSERELVLGALVRMSNVA